jgi:hypothetical protein
VAGTQTAASGSVSFADSNGVTFGMSGSSRITASIAAGATATGNLGAFAAGTVTQTSGTVLASNANGVSFGLSAGTLTGSVAAGATATGNLGGIAANGATATAGTVIFSASNGLAFGLNAGTITASYTQSTAPAAISAGTASVGAGTVVFSNSANVSFGLNGSTVTASASYSQSTAPGAIAAGTQTATSGTVIWSNSNGVSFGLNAGTLTASVNGGGGGGVAVSAGTASQSTGTVIFSNSNGITFGLSAGTLTGSVAGASAGIAAVSGGTTLATSGTLVFSNANGVSFGINGNTITASTQMDTSPFYDNLDFGATNSAGIGVFAFTNSHRSLFLGPLDGNHIEFPDNITASTMHLNLSLSGSTATASAAFTSRFYLGIYTENGTNLSLLNSVQASFGFAAAATNNSTGFAGARFLPIASSLWSSSPVFVAGSRYHLGWFWSSSGGTVNQTGQLLGFGRYSSGQRSGSIGVSQVTATSVGYAPFYGVYTATTSALPVSIANSQLNKALGTAAFVPHVQMIAATQYSVF